jgi:hypothetical protein
MPPELPVKSAPPTVQPLAELPALNIADVSRDIRGWEIRSDAGDILGVVSDLLADPDRLVAEFLVVSPSKPGDVQIVPLAALSARPPYLVLGSGLEPIKLRYVSTVRLAAQTGAIAAFVVIIGWLLRLVAC